MLHAGNRSFARAKSTCLAGFQLPKFQLLHFETRHGHGHYGCARSMTENCEGHGGPVPRERQDGSASLHQLEKPFGAPWLCSTFLRQLGPRSASGRRPRLVLGLLRLTSSSPAFPHIDIFCNEFLAHSIQSGLYFLDLVIIMVLIIWVKEPEDGGLGGGGGRDAPTDDSFINAGPVALYPLSYRNGFIYSQVYAFRTHSSNHYTTWVGSRRQADRRAVRVLCQLLISWFRTREEPVLHGGLYLLPTTAPARPGVTGDPCLER